MKLLERLLESFATALRPREGESVPVALVWTDATSEWLPLLPQLRMLLPELFVLGPYQPELRSGPAIWLKCVVERALPHIAPPDKTPILFLPGVGRQELRAGAECPDRLKPLVELQFRGRVWHQANGRDWTVNAFLVSEAGLGLDIAQDRRTEEAMLRALPLLADSEVIPLLGRRLDADDFDKLAVTDPVRDVLRWMSAPKAFDQARGSRWEAFRAVCLREFQFDPERDGVAEAGARLAASDRAWNTIWMRFCESPRLYPGVPKSLPEHRRGLLDDPERYPSVNQQEEDGLRKALDGLATLEHGEACRRTLELERNHSERRGWVWARMGQSPWAQALEPLAKLARLSQTPVGGSTVEAIVSAYAGGGWECDLAAMDALAAMTGSSDRAIIANAVHALYEPWLDASARHFQEAMRRSPIPKATVVPTEKESCLLFVDGLRFDQGGRLAAKLQERALTVRMIHRLAALPTVTATAKPAVTPIANDLEGGSGEDFAPSLGARTATAPILRDAMERRGVEMLSSGEDRFPSGSMQGGWVECGKIDTCGHTFKGDLPLHLDRELDQIADRIEGLLKTGWRRVRVVTDHGWLLLPTKLPKTELPHYLTATKWSRCAVLKGIANVAIPNYPWHWNPDVRIASPIGIACFREREQYSHGGLSPQECVVPEIVVERGAAAIWAFIRSVEWRGMRVRVGIESSDPGVQVDLRLNARRSDTSIAASAKEVGSAKEVSLAVADDQHEGAAATVVLLNADGEVLDRRTTSVGESE